VVFRTVSPPIAPDSETDRNGVITASEYQTHPFFFIPTLSSYQGKVIAIVGTGDRDMLIPPADASTDLRTALCTEIQRLYALEITGCGTRPCNESDLVEVSDSSRTYATPSADKKGWFMKLQAGEKVATPYEIVGGYALYSTFTPSSTVCAGGGVASICSTDSKGEARLYVRNYVTGKPLDWDNDGLITDEATYVVLGSGVPTAPSVSTSVAGGVTTSTIFAGGADTGLVSRQFGSGSTSLVGEIMILPVSHELHDIIHQGR
jgi:hypothetical protein